MKPSRVSVLEAPLLGSMAVPTLMVFGSLLLCCCSAWSQSPQTNVFGIAAACGKANQYNITAKGDITDQTSKSCTLPPPEGPSAASVSSSASLDLGLSALGSATNLASADSRAANAQTATLKPPKGFTGTKVTFSFKDAYALKLAGSLFSGQAETCWTINQLKFSLCQLRTTVGVSSGTITQKLVLTKSSKGFQLTIAKEAVVGVGAVPKGTASGGVATSSVVNLSLPKGWTCTYDSGSKCP